MLSDKFKLKVNDKPLKLHEARVSAYPFNRVWPGYQRSIEQTETAWFASCDFDNTATFEIEVMGEPVKTVELRPFEFGIDYTVAGNKILFTLSEPRHFTVEVNGCHRALHIFTQRPLTYIRKENDLYFGPGEHYPGIIIPKSGQTVYIDENAVVYGAIFINHASDVKITGRGILDSSHLKRGEEATPSQPGGELAAKLYELGFSNKDMRYSGSLVAIGAKNLIVEGIIFRDSMFWTIITRNGCRDVLIDNIKIIGQWRYNSDGIDICCGENISVRNCFIRTFDDCLVVRGAYLEGEDGMKVANVLVEDCVMWCDWGKSLEIWTGDKPARIENVAFVNNYLIHLASIAIDITTYYGSSNTYVGNIHYENIFIDSDTNCLLPSIQRSDDQEYQCNNRNFQPELIRIECGKLGKNTGNQGILSATDHSEFHLTYANIIFNNIRVNDKLNRQLAIVIDNHEKPLKIANIILHDVRSDNLAVAQEVSNFSIN